MDSAEGILKPCWLMHIIIIAQKIWLPWKDIHTSWLEKMHVDKCHTGCLPVFKI